MPVLALALLYWLHLIATVIWFGGLIVLVLAGFVPPKDTFLDRLERRVRPWTNLSLAVLLLTGIVQMGADEHYTGLLRIENAWTAGLLAKHLAIGGILVITSIIQWGVRPTLQRAQLLACRTNDGTTIEHHLHRRLRRLTTLNLVLGLLVLLFTAIITAL